jgi:hypothetical protein
VIMKANQLVQKLGHKLLGQKVNTPPVGEYPGGVATVIPIAPNENAPEIVFQVSLPQWGEIGVFEHEDVSLLLGQLGLPQCMSTGGTECSWPAGGIKPAHLGMGLCRAVMARHGSIRGL